jgi:hypothetical protein
MPEKQRLEGAFVVALDTMVERMRAKSPNEELINNAKYSLDVYNVLCKGISADNHAKALNFQILHTIFPNPNELREHLTTIAPELKLLDQPKQRKAK